MKSAFILFSILFFFGCAKDWSEMEHDERMLYLAETEFNTKKPILFYWSMVCPNENIDLFSGELISAGYGVQRIDPGYNPGTSFVNTEHVNIPRDLKAIRQYAARLQPIASKYGCDSPSVFVTGHEK